MWNKKITSGGLKPMAKKLNQIIAILRHVKENSQKQTTDLYQNLKKEGLFSGMARTYRPIDDDGEKLPAENKIVQMRVTDVLKRVAELEVPFYDLIAQQDAANCLTKADVIVNGKTVLTGMPATTLLWLEHRLQDMHSVLVDLPELPQTDKWAFDQNQNCYAAEEVQTSKSKKVPKVIVKYEATEKHPAQTELLHEDKLAGYWTTVNFSGALPKDKKQQLRERCEALLAAVKQAREEANLQEVSEKKIGQAVFNHLYEGLL